MKKPCFKIMLFCLIHLSGYQATYSQEGNHFEVDQFSLDIDLKYKQLYLARLFDDYKFRVDPEVSQYRKKDTLAYSSPFQHSALYFKVGFDVSYKNKYRLYFNTFLEQRSWSAGVNNLDRYVVFPQFRFHLKDTITLWQHDLEWMFKLGNIYTDDELTSGLRAYNIDHFGYIAQLKYRKSKLSLFFSGDMAVSIGLFIGDYYYLKYSRLMGNNLEFGASFGSAYNFRWKPEGSKWYPNYGLYMKKGMSNIQLLMMLEYADKNKNLKEEKYTALGGLFKISYKKMFNKSNIKAEAKIRHLGTKYLLAHYGGSTYLYRSDLSREGRGEYLYPLKNYFRPVSQFALYSEYRWRKVLSYELNISWKQRLFPKCYHDLKLEFLNINTDNYFNDDPNTSFTYYYYTYFLYYNIFPGFKAGFYLTNKLMNVDVLYQTFYQSNKPFYGIHFTWDGKFRLK
ncbi:MAG: hypothetical protein ACOCXH_12935 [Cyclobacteriaceae bacterium]